MYNVQTDIIRMIAEKNIKKTINPRCSMYGLFTYMKGEKWLHSRGNVGKYSHPMEHLGTVQCTNLIHHPLWHQNLTLLDAMPPTNDQSFPPWDGRYIYLHLIDYGKYGKYRQIYQSHGSSGFLLQNINAKRHCFLQQKEPEVPLEALAKPPPDKFLGMMS